MTTSPSAPPTPVQREADQARRLVHDALDFEIDTSDASLPVLDHYLSQLDAPSPEQATPALAAVGCHFGEVVRARFGGTWHLGGDDPERWRLEIPMVGLSFCPSAMAAQAVYHGREPRWDDGVAVPPKDQEALHETLARTAQLPEDVYYSLASRYDTLELIVDFLMARHAEQQRGQS